MNGAGESKSMAKVTSKLRVTVPKAIAEEYGIRPGDEIEWVPAGDAIRVVLVLAGRQALALDPRLRLKLFDAATRRQRRRRLGRPKARARRDRGWKREDLHSRARPR